MTIGDQLKAARNERGLSLNDVANRTRVRERVIAEIESDSYKSVGGLAYARGHIRTLAQIYGMDVQSLLNQFDALHVGEEGSMSEKLEENSVTTSVERTKPSWKLFGMVAGLAIFTITAFQVVPGALESEQPSRIISAAEDLVSGKEEPPAVASATKGVNLSLRAIGTVSWVKVSGASGQTIFEGKLRQGQSQDFFDDQLIQLVIGNAGAIAITYNGEDLGATGSVGEVTRLQFTPESDTAG
jgi:cytoskeleton protein RodZ